MLRTTLLCLLLAGFALGCASGAATRCESAARYVTSASSPPLRIPDDLAPPDESEALRIPQEPEAMSGDAAAGGCLESPPPYQQSTDSTG
jgi:uncharacterized lipoprotein